jgi:multimeric flavodoxin WrbA
MNASHIKVLALNGSARNDNDLPVLLQYVLTELEREGIQTELVELRMTMIHACLACDECETLRNGQCAQTDDMGNTLIEKMAQADGILFGSPTEEADISPQMKALLERACSVAQANHQMFRHKVGAAVVSVHSAGAIQAFDTLSHFFMVNEMVVPGTSYWNAGIGRQGRTVDSSTDDYATMKTLGKNMAWLLENLKGQFAFPDLVEIVSQ